MDASQSIDDFHYCGKLSSRNISTEEEELSWDISSCRHKWYEGTTEFRSPEFRFVDAKCMLFAELAPDCIKFGIRVRSSSTPVEVFDCCCNLSCRNLDGEIFKSSEFEFTCAEGIPEIVMKDIFNLKNSVDTQLRKVQENAVIVCRFSAKRSTDTTYSSKTKAEKQIRITEKDDGSSKVNSVCKCCKDFRQLLQSEEGSDVILKVGDHSFKAHRTILFGRCSVFASMFRHNMKEKAAGVVNIEDCDASSFPVLLDFLYCGSTEKITRENVFGLYTSSDKYNVKDLKMECLEFIKNNLSVETFCEAVRLSLRHSESELLKFVINFFAKNFKEIVVTLKWQEFIQEYPTQSNEILTKALASGAQDDKRI